MSGAGNTNTPSRLELPALHQLEAEGDDAAQELARALVRETMRTGGRIDVVCLERAGPSVQAAYRRMLARAAARSITPAAPKPAAQTVGTTAVPMLPGGAGGTAAGPAALPRIAKGWRTRCRPAPDFKDAARFRGRLAGAIATAAALTTVFLLDL